MKFNEIIQHPNEPTTGRPKYMLMVSHLREYETSATIFHVQPSARLLTLTDENFLHLRSTSFASPPLLPLPFPEMT